MKVNEYKKGDIVFMQGDFARSFFRVLNGSIGICLAYGTENEKQLTVLREGEYLGEMGVFEVYPRSATAVVLEDGTRLEEIGENELSDYFTTRTEDLLEIMRQVSGRLRERTEDYEEACRVLDEIRKTSIEPEKRSRKLLDKILELVTLYGEAMMYKQ